ncbi:MAG: hypothetical protein FJ301_10715 [Planctomycetes bacterium]|nr:hypothetical protein [Planctomycetota bacterium]
MHSATEATAWDDGPRERALAHCRAFCARLLPAALRRVAAWKGVPRRMHADLLEELGQEMVVDALAHAAEVVALPPRARHLRWMRLADRYIYRHCVAARRRITTERDGAPSALDELPAPGSQPWQLAPTPALEVATLANGRCNLAQTAARAGVPTRQMRRELDRVATRCGSNPAQQEFWRARLAEGLVGLAADLLRAGNRVFLLPRARPAPDVAARRRRLRRLARHLPLQPATRAERQIARRCLRTGIAPEAARALLADATELAPHSAAAWGWRFEALIAAGEAGAAAIALRHGRRLAALPAATSALARARLREARGDRVGAVRLLRRALARRPRDLALRAAATAAGLVDSSESAPQKATP